MVRLEKIVIQGFKSFKRKVSIPFPQGFSVITGPNGSGKSNVSDAISFVIGKKSARSMRAKKTNELIFHGSKSKSGVDFANVTMYFDNHDEKLPVKDKTVTVSRRVNAKGVSTYRLNGRVVTREQVVDFLFQAGINPDGHNVIQQGDVTHIVEMDSIQRRQIIDDISGIAEYYEKKTKAQKELDRIDEKVKEAEIVLNEKTSIMERIQKDRESALKFKDLETNLEKVKTSLLLKDFRESKNEMSDLDKKITEKTKEADKLEKEIGAFDARLIQEEKKLEEITKDVVKASGQIEVSKKLGRLQTEIEAKRQKIELNEKEMERLDSFVDKIKGLDRRINPATQAVLKMKGVFGTFSELIQVPSDYRVAVEVAAGARLGDVVVDTNTNAIACVKHLKERRIGRARFLPLNKINPGGRTFLPKGAIGWLADLVKYESRYAPAAEFVLGRTAVVDNINTAKRIMSIQRCRMVTLDGDLIEPSGAITGGFYKKQASSSSFQTNSYSDEKRKLKLENEHLEAEIRALSKELNIFAEKEKKTDTFSFEKKRIGVDDALSKFRDKRRKAYEKRVLLQQEIGKFNIAKAKLEARFDNLKVQWGERPDLKKTDTRKLHPFFSYDVAILRKKEKELMQEMNMLGPLNLKAIEEYDELKDEFEEFKEKVDKIIEEKDSIEKTIATIEEKRLGTFMTVLNDVNDHFKKLYHVLTGGIGELELEIENNIDSGLVIRASPGGKRLLSIDSMSGGEKSITAFAFLFAIQKHQPSPFYVLDEADAALDKMNTKRIVDLVKSQSKLAQFILISHNDYLIREAKQVYGVTMQDGESKILGIELPQEAAPAKAVASKNS